MKNLIMALVLALGVNLAQAMEVEGVKFDEQARVGNSDVVLNGAGLRKKVFFKVYAMGLYLPQKQGDADAVLAAKGSKRVAITLLRDLTAKQFVDALQEGIVDNHSDAEMAALKDRVAQFSDTMLAIGEAKTGAIVLIDWLPEAGTRLTFNGQVQGQDIPGEDFYNALLRIWLGKNPVQDDLKQALLGQAS
ncbi:MAG: chalcone isomerase family protein [Propionivibrio sp.]